MKARLIAGFGPVVLALALGGCGSKDKDDDYEPPGATVASALGGHGGHGHKKHKKHDKQEKHDEYDKHDKHDKDDWEDGDDDCGKDDHKVRICHVRDESGKPPLELKVDEHAVPAHIAHGDWVPAKGEDCEPPPPPCKDVIEPPPPEDVVQPPPPEDVIQPPPPEDVVQPPPPEDVVQPPPPEDAGTDVCVGKCGADATEPPADEGPPPTDAGPPTEPDLPVQCPPGENCQAPA